MKKTITILFTLVILLMFSGCDPILEILYPDEKIEDVPNNTINVFVQVGSTLLVSPEYQAAPHVNIQLRGGPSFSEIYGEGEIWDINYTWEMRSFSFGFLPPGDYRVVIYFDKDWNWMPDSGESNILATKYGTVNQTLTVDNGAPPEGYYYEMEGILSYSDNDLFP